jgi:hypothetical protein
MIVASALEVCQEANFLLPIWAKPNAELGRGLYVLLRINYH